jgi:hydroxyacid-oxoacid transhydrogenase
VQTAPAAIEAAGVEAVLFDRVRVEPTDGSFRDAIQYANAHEPDGIVAVGGGSVIDTPRR